MPVELLVRIGCKTPVCIVFKTYFIETLKNCFLLLALTQKLILKFGRHYRSLSIKVPMGTIH